MYIIAILMALCLALCAAAEDLTSVSTYYTTFTVMNVVETKTMTSSVTETTTSTSHPPSSTSTWSSSSSSSWATTYAAATTSSVASAPTVAALHVVASSGAPVPSSNGTATYTGAVQPTAVFEGSASGLTASLGGAAAVAAILSFAQLL